MSDFTFAVGTSFGAFVDSLYAVALLVAGLLVVRKGLRYVLSFLVEGKGRW